MRCFIIVIGLILSCKRAQQPSNQRDWRVNITVTNASPDKVLRIIRKQTGMGTSFDPDLVRNAKGLSINARNAPLYNVLDSMCRNQVFNFHIKGSLIVLEPRDTSQVAGGKMKRHPYSENN